MTDGQAPQPVVIADYDPSWPIRYEEERGRIIEALGGAIEGVVAIEHVGSTSVRAIVEEFAPPLVLCGHIHEARGVARHGPTTIVNPGPAAAGHRALVEINGDIRVQLL